MNERSFHDSNVSLIALEVTSMHMHVYCEENDIGTGGATYNPLLRNQEENKATAPKYRPNATPIFTGVGGSMFTGYKALNVLREEREQLQDMFGEYVRPSTSVCRSEPLGLQSISNTNH